MRGAWLLVAVALLGSGALVLALTVGGGGSAAAPRSLEERTLAVEERLLCPQCTNKRLDVCDLAICEDMRREIRARLEAGESEADVVAFFAGRFGDRVLATVPKSGFNLWLWGWVVGCVVLIGAAGASWLRRRTAHVSSSGPRAEAPPLDDADDRWLDAQLRDGPAPGAGG